MAVMVEKEYPSNFFARERAKRRELTSEQLDGLRMEFQCFTPTEFDQFAIDVAESHRAFLDMFGAYIPQDRLYTTEDLIRRFIVVDKTQFADVESFWEGTYWPEDADNVSYSENGSIMRSFLEEGRFVIAQPFPDVWNWLERTHQQKLTERAGGDETAAHEQFRVRVSRQYLVHEITHLYQDIALPLWFIEACAYWSCQRVPMKNGWGAISAPHFDLPAQFFQSLLDFYGDEVLKLAFGCQGSVIWGEIRDEFTVDVQQKIFPEYQISQNE